MNEPITNAERVAASRARAIKNGARRIGPLLLRDLAAIAALDALAAKHGSQRAALGHALRRAK